MQCHAEVDVKSFYDADVEEVAKKDLEECKTHPNSAINSRANFAPNYAILDIYHFQDT
ncbi:MAG: hypothetical protein ACE5J9_02135 [Methanosarcinales archaeon]